MASDLKLASKAIWRKAEEKTTHVACRNRPQYAMEVYDTNYNWCNYPQSDWKFEAQTRAGRRVPGIAEGLAVVGLGRDCHPLRASHLWLHSFLRAFPAKPKEKRKKAEKFESRWRRGPTY